jgi:hypothetical protein
VDNFWQAFRQNRAMAVADSLQKSGVFMAISSQHHSFDIALATQFSIEEAIIIHHFQHWIRINKVAGRNLKDGRTWTYQTKRDIAPHFPYFSYDQVRRICDKLVEKGVLLQGNYNKTKMDKTCWFAFSDEAAFQVDDDAIQKMFTIGNSAKSIGNSANSIGKSAKPIPDSIPYTKTRDIESTVVSPPTHSLKSDDWVSKEERVVPVEASKLANVLWEQIRKRHPKAKPPNLEKWAKEIELMHRVDKREWEEIIQVIEWAFEKDAFWCKILASADKLRKNYDKMFLSMRPMENEASRIKKNRSIAFEVRASISHNETKRKNFLLTETEINRIDTKESLSLLLDPREFEEKILLIFGLRKE